MKQILSSMSFHISTKDRLLALIDDIEIISKSVHYFIRQNNIKYLKQISCRELIENTIAPKNQKISSHEHTQLVELLVSKDSELKNVLQLASEQATIEKKMDDLKTQVDEQDQEINQLQKQLKEAEQILSTAIFQARQKLTSIAKAKKRPVSSEELIKYAHKYELRRRSLSEINMIISI